MSSRSAAAVLLSGSLVLGVWGAAYAGQFTDNLTPGEINRFEDNDREAFIDNPGGTPDGVFGIGDVLIGFLKVESKTSPDGVHLDNSVYGIFSQQVVDVIDGQSAVFGPTTVAGLTLADITGNAGISAESVFAIYDRDSPYPVDLIIASPGNVGTGGAVTMADYINFITLNGDLAMVGEISTNPRLQGGDFLIANSVFVGVDTVNPGPCPVTGTTVACLGETQSVGGFSAGFTNDPTLTGLQLDRVTPSNSLAPDPAVGVGPAGIVVGVYDIAVTQGAISGFVDAVNAAEWTNASELGASGWTQCEVNGQATSCGFTTNLTFALQPTQVPVPASLVLVGSGLLGVALLTRRLRRSCACAPAGAAGEASV